VLVNIKKLDEFPKRFDRKSSFFKDDFLTTIIIILLNADNIMWIKRCINSIKRNTAEKTYEIITVIGMDKGGDMPWIQQHSDIVLLYEHKSHENFTEAYNEAIKISRGRQILFLHPYACVIENWLPPMIELLYSNDQLGIVSPSLIHSNDIGNYLKKISIQNMGELKDFLLKSENTINITDIKDGCLLIKKKVIDEIGFLDQRYSPFYSLAEDYVLTVRIAGYQLGLCKKSFVHYNDGQGIQKNFEKQFQDKWGFSLESYKENRQSFFKFICRYVKDNDKVLDIDTLCYKDLLGIQKINKKAILFGLTDNRYIDKINLEHIKIDLCLEKFNEKFNVIIIPNLFSKGNNMEKTLMSIKPYLNNNGVVVVRVENAMHYSYIYQLIQGDFPKKLSNACTYDDFSLLCKKAGYIIDHVEGINAQIERKEIEEKIELFINENNKKLLKAKTFFIAIKQSKSQL
jgi:GT2 family glycosyltransferase